MLDVLYEDNHCPGVNKPAGLLRRGDATGESTLIDAAKDYLENGKVRQLERARRLVHRLDRHRAGIVLLARPQGRARLSSSSARRSRSTTGR